MAAPSFWDRIRDTRLVQTLVVYLAGAWIALQVVALFTNAFDWPKWVMRASIVVLATGLVVTLLAVWAHGRASRAGAAVRGEPDGRSRSVVAGVALACLLLVGAALLLIVQDRGRSFSPTEAVAGGAAPGVAILPFRVSSDRISDWREGAVDLLSISLDGLPGLRAIDNRTTLAAWRERIGENDEPGLDAALDVARAIGARWAVVGNATASGSRIILTADVYDLEDGTREIGTTPRLEGAQEAMLDLADRLTIEILNVMAEGGVADLPPIDLARVTTSSLPALKTFLEGEAAFRTGDYEAAIPAYAEAVEIDSTFALAHYRLGDAYGWTETLGGTHVLEHYEAAARHVDRLPERDADLLEISLAYASGLPESTDLARAAAEKYPDDPHARFLLGETRFHLPRLTLATPEEKRAPFAEAIRLDPSYVPALIHLLDLAFAATDSARVDSLLHDFRRIGTGTFYDVAYSTAFGLTFADTLNPSAAAERLVDLPQVVPGRVVGLVFHPRFFDRVPEILAAFERAELLEYSLGQRTQLLLAEGRVDSLVRLARGDAFDSPAALQALGMGKLIGAPIPDEILERYFPGEDTRPTDFRVGFAAALALDKGNRSYALEVATNARSMADSLLAAGDTLPARQLGAIDDLLRGRDAMLRGRDAEALDRLERAYRLTEAPPAAIWAAELEEKAGRLDRAERYLVQLAPMPWIGQRLGSLYERTGDLEKAKDAYSWVVLGWRNADAALQPRVVEARGAIARLEGLQRG